MNGVYSTYEEIKEYLITSGADRGALVQSDDLLKTLCVDMSRTLDSFCRRSFIPTRETRTFYHPVQDPCQLVLDGDLLQIETLTHKNGGETITGYFLKYGTSYNRSPARRVELDQDAAITRFAYSGTPQKSISLTGLWGYHDDWSNAWSQVGTVQDAPLLVGATSLTVTDASLLNVQQLLRFGADVDSEMAYITAKDIDQASGADTLTITRGVNGSAAVEQANDTAIYVFQPMEDISHALKVFSVYANRRRGSVGGDDDRSFVSGSGVIVQAASLPGEIKAMIKRYKRMA